MHDRDEWPLRGYGPSDCHQILPKSCLRVSFETVIYEIVMQSNINFSDSHNNFSTITHNLLTFIFRRPAIAKPIDSGIFVDEFPEEASTRASSVAIANYQVPNVRKQLINNHHSG